MAKLRAHLTSHLQHALNGCGHILTTSQLLQVPWSGWVGFVIGLQVEGDEKIHGKMLGKIIGLPGISGKTKNPGTSATKLKL